MKRRDFVKLMTASVGSATLASCGPRSSRGERSPHARCVVLAFDGLDPRVLDALIQRKQTPHLARLAPAGPVTRLQTSMPPHTPVAFSSIITGAGPERHHIFDFIHRDPAPQGSAAIRPFFSTADTGEPERNWALSAGNWSIPLSSSQTQLLRQGTPFWDHLIRQGVDASVYYLPANYPPQTPPGPGQFRCVSGMGTPDLAGSYGEFTLFTPDVSRRGRTVGGGRFVRLRIDGHRGQAVLQGPPNFLRRPDDSGRIPPATAALDVVRDPEHRAAKITVSGAPVVLGEGEWSSWLPVEFPTELPGSTVIGATGAPTSIWGMIRIYLKQVHPNLIMYVSPINIDPARPVSPISVPARHAQDLAARHGRFCTLGIPEDTKALTHGALSEDEFLAQSEQVNAERREQFRAALRQQQFGCLFFYFGSSDLLQHMFWRDQDPQHPGFRQDEADRYGDVVNGVYRAADQIVGETLEQLHADDTLLVLSDHGFTSFRRGFNVNSWLADEGYLQLPPQFDRGRSNLLADADWARVTAYGLGMNGLYLNMVGREKTGTVKAKQRRVLLQELREKLLEVRDADGASVIRRVDVTEETYPEAPFQLAPDLIIGYDDGYRASWDTILGDLPHALITDNAERWSGTHLIDADRVPGVILSNRPITATRPTVCDVAPTILASFDIATPPAMTGRDLLAAERPRV